MRQSVHKFLIDIDNSVISVLRNQNVLSKKLTKEFEELRTFLQKDEKNIFILFDILACCYLSEDTGLETIKSNNHIPLSLFDAIISNLNNAKYKKAITNSSSGPQKIIMNHVAAKVRALIIDIFTRYHAIKITLPKNDKTHSLLILLLVEYLYRTYFVHLTEIKGATLLKCIRDKEIYDKLNTNPAILTSVMNYASTIQKNIDNGGENKTV